MSNTDSDNTQSTGKLNTGDGIVTDGAGVVGNQQQDSGSLLGETWEKIAVGSGTITIIAVLFLPILSLNIPEGASQLFESVGGSSLTLGDARDIVSSLAQLSALGGGGSSGQLSTASTVLNVSFYLLIGGGGLLIAGGLKKRVVAIAGAVAQTLPVLGLTYAVFALIPDVIQGQLGDRIGGAASQLVGPGLGLYLLIAASLGGITSVVMAYR